VHIDFEKELNESQYAAVTASVDIPALVLAGAGSGKTRTLTYRVANLLLNENVKPHQLMLLTFTNKAAREMLARISKIMDAQMPHLWGGTFHSIACGFLRKEHLYAKLEPNFSILDADDAEALLKKSVEETLPKFFSSKDNPRTKLLNDIISYSRNTCLTIEKAMYERFNWLETSPSEIEEIAKAYENTKRKNNVCDFDDLLVLWLNTLLENEILRKEYSDRFKNILVDEYQDTNLLQCKILDTLAARGQISAVGDDAQCIYTWRGANIENILSFKERYPNANIFKVEANYRSTPEILNFANCILKSMPQNDVYEKVLVPKRPSLGRPHLICAMDSRGQAETVATKIREIVGHSEYKYSDIAILYRAHSHAMDMQLNLQHKGMPFVITSGLKFFEQAHIKDAISQIKFVANQKDIVSFLRFSTFLPKLGKKTAEKIYEKARSIAEKNSCEFVQALLDDSVIKSVPAASKELFKDMANSLCDLSKSIASELKNQKVQMDLSEQIEPEKSLKPADVVRMVCTNWYVKIMQTIYEDWQDRMGSFDSLIEYAGRFLDIRTFLESATLEIAETQGENTSETNRLRMMTIHQAKGLEFKVIFIIGLSDGLFPLERCIEDGDTDEEQRLFYVACTRAQDHLYLCYPRMVVKRGTFIMCDKSRFLNAIDRDFYTSNFGI